MPVIAICIVALFLIGTAFVKLGRWLKETLASGEQSGD